MVGIPSLWLPIMLSSVFVFVASTIIHMALKYHWNDWSGMPASDEIGEAFRKAGVGPGNYRIPHCQSMAEMASTEVTEKFKKGPVALVNVFPSGPPTMKFLLDSLIFALLTAGTFAWLWP